MKKTKMNLFLVMAALAFSACNKDDVAPATTGTDNMIPDETVTVSFSTKAPAFNNALLTRADGKYPANLFRIMAFRHNGTDFMYLNDVDFKNNVNYNEATQQFEGTAELPVGVYKFVPAYGLPTASDANVTLSDMTGKPALSNDLTAAHAGTLPAVYLRETADFTADTLGTHTGAQNVVKASIKRAVSRIDVLFVRATKDDAGNYTEVAGEDVFGGHTVASMVLDVKGVTPSVRLIDGGVVNGTPYNTSFTVVNTVLSDGSNNSGSTIGNGTAENPYDFDNVEAAHIMQGGVYAYGPYVFPFDSESTTANVTLTVTSTQEDGGHVYERSIDIDGVKLSRNYVTLIKIYTQRDNFFNTKPSFEIEVVEAWEGNHTSIGEAE